MPSSRRVRKRFSGLRSRWTMPASCALVSRAGDLPQPARRRPPGCRRAGRRRLQVGSFEQLHDEERRASSSGATSASVTRTMWSLLIRATRARLALEALDGERRLARQDLQRHALPRVHVLDLVDGAPNPPLAEKFKGR